MKEYKVKVKTNTTCPGRTQVLGLLDQNAASFKTIIGETLVRNAYPLYIEEEVKQNLYGFIQAVADSDGTALPPDKLAELLKTKPSVSLKSYVGTIIDAVMIVNDAQRTVVESNFVSDRIREVMDEKVAAGIVSREEMDERLALMQLNGVSEPNIYKVVKAYRKYNKPAHKPRTLYVDPFLENAKKAHKPGIIAEGIRCARLRQPTICEGEKSVGKNVYMETLAWLLGMPLYMIGFSRNMNPNAIYGEKSTDNSASEALRGMETGAIAKVMLESNQPFKNGETRAEAIKQAANFELNKAMAASVSIITDASELYDWMTDGGLMVWNGATCSATSLKR